jgi:hypothetical protein
MQKEIESRINSGNACYQSVQSLLSSRLMSKNVKVKIYKTIILPVVLYWCETWSLTLREEHGMRVFRAVFWVVLPCKMIVDRHHTRRRENLKSHME